MRRHLAAAAAGVAIVLLSACSSSDSDPSSSPSSSSSSSDSVDPSVDESAGCALLSAPERAALLGSKLDAVVASDARKGAVQCRWSSDKGLIQVTDLAAEDWAKTLPDIVAQMEQSTDLQNAKDKAQLAEAKKLLKDAESFTGDQACKAFSRLAQIDGSVQAGTNMTVTYLPITEDSVGISAQICTGGRLTSLVFSTPDLKQSKQYERKVKVALKAAHARALKA